MKENEYTQLDLEKSLKSNNIQFIENFDLGDENMEISSENFDGKKLSYSININYLKPNFFSTITKSSSNIIDNQTESGIENIEISIPTSQIILKEIKSKEQEIEHVSIEVNSNRSAQRTFDRENLLKLLVKQKANKNWNIILNALFLINRMRNVQVKRIMTNELEAPYEKWFYKNKIEENLTFKDNLTLKNSPTGMTQNLHPPQKQYKIYNDEETMQLEFIAKQSKFFCCICSGSVEHFVFISNSVINDPNKFLFDSTQKNKYFINQKNENFITALYVATINGHLRIVKFLCENGADYLIKNGVIISYFRSLMMANQFLMLLLDGKC